ncbi:Rv1535 family protein [Mycobacterium sp. M23085]|uniref:Rv1535 family protein n=1 Tax=Mycobacterium sp. M23085 TaxID=3378087 RepID=UPI003878333E
MTAVRYDDVVPAPMAPAPVQTPKPRPQAPAGSGNPLMDMTAQLLSVPLHQVYAALWRMGVIEVRG